MFPQLYTRRFLRPATALVLGLLAYTSHAQSPWVLQPQPVGIAPSPTATFVTRLVLPDPTSVWALVETRGSGGVGSFDVFYSANDGQSWQREVLSAESRSNPTTYIGTELKDVYTADGRNIWALILDNVTQVVSLRRSTTGLGGFATLAPLPAAFTHIRFFDATTGIALAPATAATWSIYRTTDAGNSWAAVNGQLPRLSNDSPAAIAMAGSSLWITTSEGQMLRTTDQGQTWTAVSPGLGTGAATAAFQDANNGLLLKNSTPPALMRTTDGGQTWQSVAFSGPLRPMSLVPVPGTSGTYVSFDGWAGCKPCSSRGSAITTDNGSTWRELDNTNYYASMAVSSPTRAWAGTAYSADLFRSTGLVTSSAQPRRPEVGLAYPNPTNGRLQLAPSAAPRELVLLDATGRQVNKCILPARASTWDVSGQQPGVYTLVCTSAEQVHTQRLVVTP